MNMSLQSRKRNVYTVNVAITLMQFKVLPSKESVIGKISANHTFYSRLLNYVSSSYVVACDDGGVSFHFTVSSVLKLKTVFI